jgi:thiol:disulfide interchange protein
MLAAGGPGRTDGWGAQLQEPAPAALLAVAAAWLALNLWGLVEAPLAPAGSSRPGTVRHLLAGLFTVPLALAWPLPMLEEPWSYAFARGPATVCAVYAVLGFGLALPYLALAAAPSLIRLAPAAAAWLPRLREGLGFLAGASVFWILHLLARQVSPEGLAWIELCLLGMALLAWLRAGQGRSKATRFALALGLAACAAGALWLAERNRLAPRTAVTAPERSLPTASSHGLPPAAREPASNQISGG